MENDVKIEYFKNLVASSTNASSRSRTTYFILCMACLFVLIGVFNMEYSWGRHINFKERSMLGFRRDLYPQDSTTKKILQGKEDFDHSNQKSKLIYDKYVDNMSNKFTEELFKRYELNIPVIGIRVFSSDLSVIASTGIVILITWLFFSVRREYHIINRIKKEFNLAHDFDYLQKLIFYGAVFENVFTTATKNNIRISSHKNSRFRIFIRRLSSPSNVMIFLKYLPVFTILATILSDWRTMDPNYLRTYLFEITTRTVYALMTLVYCFLVTRNIHKFDRNIEMNLAYMNEKSG